MVVGRGKKKQDMKTKEGGEGRKILNIHSFIHSKHRV